MIYLKMCRRPELVPDAMIGSIGWIVLREGTAVRNSGFDKAAILFVLEVL